LEVGREQDGATTLLLGGDIDAGEQPQLLVPPGHWQRARPRDDEPTLVSCVVVPGFDFADFALAAVTD
jgi:predicted cupin superfamily sugar epimerase